MGVGSENQGPRNPGNSTKGKMLAVGGGGATCVTGVDPAVVGSQGLGRAGC